MDQILVYSDNLTWGIIPEIRRRLPFDKRWPGVCEQFLTGLGVHVRIIENGLNGRRTAWDDPFKPGRDGSQGLAQVIEMHSRLKLVILMLGTNDFQRSHDHNAWLSAQGSARLSQIIRQAPIEPDILLVAPPRIIAPKKRCSGHAQELETIARVLGTFYFDAATVTEASVVDGIHLDESQHQVLGQAIGKQVQQMMHATTAQTRLV